MKVHPDGSIEGTPAECAEYHRIRGEQSVRKDTQTKTTLVTGIGDADLLEQIRRQNELEKPWQPRTWPFTDLRWCDRTDVGSFTYQPPYQITHGTYTHPPEDHDPNGGDLAHLSSKG